MIVAAHRVGRAPHENSIRGAKVVSRRGEESLRHGARGGEGWRQGAHPLSRTPLVVAAARNPWVRTGLRR
jgi:hypothetical protein